MNKIFNLIVIAVIISKVQTILHNSGDEFNSSQIVLFYSPLNSELIRGQIVIYWHVPDFIEGDKLNLYYGHPDLNQIVPIYSHKPVKKSGFIKTGVPPTHAFYDVNSSFVEQCTGYYGAWLRNGTIVKLNCLSTYPDWMSKLKNRLQYMTLGNLFIPGTHNSGSYSEEIPQTLTKRYTVTQDRSILDQLVSGARYLDLRPCKYITEYWICHGSYYMQPFELVIDDIKEFMNHTEEIVILSIKEFPNGFCTDDHKDFINYLSKHLIDYIVKRPPGSERTMTLGQIWKSKKRLIVSYNYNLRSLRFTSNINLFWSPIIQEWGNVHSDIELKNFINHCETFAKDAAVLWRGPLSFRAMMAEVTLDATSIVTDSVAHIVGQGSNSLREISAQIGPLVTAWYNEDYYSSANIVAVDFIDATGIVQIAIHWNKIRSDRNYNNYVNRLNIKH